MTNGGSGAKPRVRVLWLVKGLGAGGAERLLVSFARLADHDRFAYEAAYVLPEKTALAAGLRESGVRIHCLGDAARGGVRWPLRLRRLLSAGRYDVVHLHSPLVAGVARGIVRTLPRSGRPALVSTEHNTWDSYRVPTRMLNASLHHTDAARWAVSAEVSASIAAGGGGEVATLVHGIVLDDVRVRADARERVRGEFGIGDNEVVAVTVANIRRDKAYPDLLHAAQLLVDSHENVRFIAVGQGPDENAVRNLHKELGLGARVLLPGYRSDVMEMLAAADLFVLASHAEGLPVAVMEAMAMGLPVVATRVGGLPDFVTDGAEGLLVPAGRPDLLAEAIRRLAEDGELRQAMGAAARLQSGRFDMHRVIREVERAYLEVSGANAADRQVERGRN